MRSATHSHATPSTPNFYRPTRARCTSASPRRWRDAQTRAATRNCWPTVTWQAGRRDLAAPYCETAGDDAEGVYAYDDALVWYERAADGFGDEGPDAPRALWKASVAAVGEHETARGAALHERAIALHLARGDAAEAVRVSNSLAGMYFNDGRSDRAVAVFRNALGIADDARDPVLRRNVLIRMFSAYAASRRVPEARDCAAAIDETTVDERHQSALEYYLAKSSLHAQIGERETWRDPASSARSTFSTASSPATLCSASRTGQSPAKPSISATWRRRAEHALKGLALARVLKTDVAYMVAMMAEIELRAGRVGDGALALARRRSAPRVPRGRTASWRRLLRDSRHLSATTTFCAPSIDLALFDEARERNSWAIPTLGSAVGLGLRRLGRSEEAFALLDAAAEALESPFGYAPSVMAIALLRPAQATRLRELVAVRGHRRLTRRCSH